MLTSPAPRGGRAVLEDSTGRRGRWMRRLGRTFALLVFAWLVVLLLGGLGLAPVADLPFAEALRPSKGPEPLATLPKPRRPPARDLSPALPLATPTDVTAGSAPPSPSGAGRARSVRRVAPRPTATPVRPVPPGRTRTAPPGRSAQAPGRSGATTPGKTQSPPGQTRTTPGRSASAPGQAKKTTAATTTTAVPTTTRPGKPPRQP
jgi:hypothetical protein